MMEARDFYELKAAARKVARPLLMPRSPFEAEKLALGYGFLAPVHPRSRAGRRYTLQKPPKNPKYPHLTDEQRDYIGSTDRSVPAWELAEEFGIKVRYVYELRKEYRRRMRSDAE
jgi:hypothetical protein